MVIGTGRCVDAVRISVVLFNGTATSAVLKTKLARRELLFESGARWHQTPQSVRGTWHAAKNSKEKFEIRLTDTMAAQVLQDGKLVAEGRALGAGEGGGSMAPTSSVGRVANSIEHVGRFKFRSDYGFELSTVDAATAQTLGFRFGATEHAAQDDDGFSLLAPYRHDLDTVPMQVCLSVLSSSYSLCVYTYRFITLGFQQLLEQACQHRHLWDLAQGPSRLM